MKCCQLIEIRHKCKEDTSLEGKEVRNTIVLTFAFQVVYTAFNALQNLHSSLHDEESLGNISLAIMSGTAIVSSVLSPTIIGLIGAKTSIVAFFVTNCIYILANFYPSFASMTPAAIAVGAFQGPAWTSQALYISASAFSFSKSSSASPYSILSRFNGFFFAVYATSQIVGNLVTSTVIKDGVGNNTDDTSAFKYCGPDDCPASENATVIEDPEDWVIDITLGFFMGCVLLGLLMIIVLLSPLPRSEWIQRVGVRSTTTSCFNVLVSTNMILLSPFIIFTAMENAFLRSAYTKSYVACPIGIHMVGYVMATYGATTPLFVLIVTKMARVAGRFILLTLSMATHLILFIILYFWAPTPEYEAVIFIIPMVWGVAESILQAQANALIAMLFPNQKEPAFANFHAWRSLGYAVTYLNASYMCVATKLLVCMAFAGLGMLLYIVVEIRTKIKEKRALKKPRASIASVQSEVELRRENTRASVSSNRTSASSIQSVQDRLSFDRVELTDIIMEAQQGWSRSEDGLTLEINRVMSMEHLAGSKVTNWYHSTSVISDFTNKLMPRTSSHPPGLPRSLSDGHLHYAAVKVDAALTKMRLVRSHTVDAKPHVTAPPLPKRRHVSDINPPTFHIIREILYEEDEFAMENETDIDAYTFKETSKDDNVFETDDDEIDAEEAKRIMDYRNLIRRFSETLNKDNVGQQDNLEEEDTSVSDVSLSSSTQDFQTNQAEEDNDQQNHEKIVFTIGTTSPYSSGQYNEAFESEDSENIYGLGRNSLLNQLAQRSISYDSDIFYDEDSEVSPHVIDVDSNSVKVTTAAESSHTEEKKSRVFNVINSIKRKTRKISTGSSKRHKSSSAGDNVYSPDNREGEDNDSDKNSDGFVNYKFDDNENYLSNGVNGVERMKLKKKVPVNEAEDVNSIY